MLCSLSGKFEKDVKSGSRLHNKNQYSSEATVKYEPRHDKTSKVTVRPVKTQISLGIRSV